MTDTLNSTIAERKGQGINLLPMSDFGAFQPGVHYLENLVTGLYVSTAEGTEQSGCIRQMNISNAARTATKGLEPWYANCRATVDHDILAQVGMARLNDMSVAPQDTIPEDVRDQARRTLEDNPDILGKLAAEIDSVVDPAVRAASVATIGQCVEAQHRFPGWRDKAVFWTNEVESYVRRNQPEGSRASNPAPTQTVTEPPASAAFTDARKSGATDLQTLKDAYFAKERLEASQRKAKGPAKD